MSHTPSITTTAAEPATSPLFSTSGILNQQVKEKNRQGLMSTYSGRTGTVMDINKFANAKIEARDNRALPYLEQLTRLLSDVKTKAALSGVAGDKTQSSSKAHSQMNAYNSSVSAVDNYLSQYNAGTSGITKATGIKNYDQRAFHQKDYAAANAGAIKESVSNINSNADLYNSLAKGVKAQTAGATGTTKK